MNKVSNINRAIERGHYGRQGVVLVSSGKFWNGFWRWNGAPKRAPARKRA